MIPFFSQRRLDVTRRDFMQKGGDIFFRLLLISISSIRGIGANPPILAKASRLTNISWSPVQIPVSRDRLFIKPSMIRNSGCVPLNRTSNRPQDFSDDQKSVHRQESNSAGNTLSACRNIRMSPVAASAPLFIWLARPAAASIILH